MTTGSASHIDEQILAIWRALRVNPSLDARWAMQVIDRLLDERPRPGQLPPLAAPPGPPGVTPPTVVLPGLVSSPLGQQAILASIIRALMAGEPG